MSSSGRNLVADVNGAQAALTDLCRPFCNGEFLAECDVVQPDSVPAPSDKLLIHHNHMTVELERHHGLPVEVQVLQEHHDGDYYTRKIALNLTGTDKIVEWGIARLDLRFLSPDVRDEVLAKKTPLGAILIQHNVHRRIKPRYFVRFPAGSPVFEIFGAGKNVQAVYGRLGTIYCNDEPAIDLLEIVVNTEVKKVP
jgi:hypothetical protein